MSSKRRTPRMEKKKKKRKGYRLFQRNPTRQVPAASPRRTGRCGRSGGSRRGHSSLEPPVPPSRPAPVGPPAQERPPRGPRRTLSRRGSSARSPCMAPAAARAGQRARPGPARPRPPPRGREAWPGRAGEPRPPLSFKPTRSDPAGPVPPRSREQPRSLPALRSRGPAGTGRQLPGLFHCNSRQPSHRYCPAAEPWPRLTICALQNKNAVTLNCNLSHGSSFRIECQKPRRLQHWPAPEAARAPSHNPKVLCCPIKRKTRHLGKQLIHFLEELSCWKP